MSIYGTIMNRAGWFAFWQRLRTSKQKYLDLHITRVKTVVWNTKSQLLRPRKLNLSSLFRVIAFEMRDFYVGFIQSFQLSIWQPINSIYLPPSGGSWTARVQQVENRWEEKNATVRTGYTTTIDANRLFLWKNGGVFVNYDLIQNWICNCNCKRNPVLIIVILGVSLQNRLHFPNCVVFSSDCKRNILFANLNILFAS